MESSFLCYVLFFSFSGIIVIVWICNYLGVFKKFKVKMKVLHECYYFHNNFQGSVRDIGKIYDGWYKKIPKIGRKIMKEGIGRFSFFCFDNPNDLVNPNDFRFCLGILISKKYQDEELAEVLIKGGLQKVELPKSNSFSVSFPYKGECSYRIQTIKAWKALSNYSHSKKDHPSNKGIFGGYIEICNKVRIECHIPDDNFEKFYITKLPPPKLKSNKRIKTDESLKND